MTKADTTKILHTSKNVIKKQTEKGEGNEKRTKRVKDVDKFSNNFKNKDSAKVSINLK